MIGNPTKYPLFYNNAGLIQNLIARINRKEDYLFRADWFLWKPSFGTNNGNGLNLPQNTTGNLSTPAISGGSLLNRLRKLQIASNLGINQNAVFRSNVTQVLSETGYKVGFRFSLISTGQDGTSSFIGLYNTLGTITTDISTLVNFVGLAYESTDIGGTWFVVSKGAGGIMQKIPIAGFPKTDLLNVLELIIETDVNNQEITVTLYDWTNNILLIQQVLNINVPALNIPLGVNMSFNTRNVNTTMTFQLMTIYGEMKFNNCPAWFL